MLYSKSLSLNHHFFSQPSGVRIGGYYNIMEKLTHYVTGKLDKFVVLSEGIAYWFKTKDQYLYRVTPSQTFHEEAADITVPVRQYREIEVSFISMKTLVEKRTFYANHPVDAAGRRRQGVELVPEYQEGGRR